MMRRQIDILRKEIKNKSNLLDEFVKCKPSTKAITSLKKRKIKPAV